MCGEKQFKGLNQNQQQGSPPHVRGKVMAYRKTVKPKRITPACAGKSCFFIEVHTCSWDHPRMCGEKGMLRLKHSRKLGSPPHVRGKENQRKKNRILRGITPACAGKRSGGRAAFT